MGGDAAFHILADEHNQLLPMWRTTSTYVEEITIKLGKQPEEAIKYAKTHFCLKDRVLQLCHVLQQITAHQDDVHSRDGVGARVKLTLRRQLEGFEFMDLATNQGTVWPQVDYIHAYGEGWVDFTRQLHCVTLFGTGFGKLMQPIGDSCRLCMSNIPQGPHLLGVTTTDLLDIIEKRGNDSQIPWRVAGDIYWYVPDKLFEPCSCVSVTVSKRDRVQVFVPTKRPDFWTRRFQGPQLVADGAILIGHSFKRPLRWGQDQEPEEGEPELPTEHSDGLPHDSGIGSSMSAESVDDSGLGTSSQSARYPPDLPRLHSSGPAIFFHANRQFVETSTSSKDASGQNFETMVLPSSSSSGPRDIDCWMARNGEPEYLV